MNEWKAVDQDMFQTMVTSINERDRKLLEYVYTHRICKLSTLYEKFPDKCESLVEFLAWLGSINNKIYRKHKCAVYPKQAAYTLEDSTYSLGVIG